MKLLVDTHIFLWFVNDDHELNNHIKDMIEDRKNIIYLSIASLWEMSIKYNLGKLKLDKSYEEFIRKEIYETRLILLNININHLIINANLPFHHKDPFDRLIISQSIAEKIPIISVDSTFVQYSINIIN